MNNWNPSDPNYYGINSALDDLISFFVKDGNGMPTSEEIHEAVMPFFRRAGLSGIGKTEQQALDSIQPMLWEMIQQKMEALA